MNIKYSKDNEKIVNDFLEYFKQLQIEEVKPTDIPDTVPLREIYEINFTDKETYSKLKIEVLNKKYIIVINYIYKKIINKEKNITSYEETVNSAIYKIHNMELDLNYIENIFNTLETKEVKNRINLFPNCKEYDGNEKKNIIIHDEEKTVKFVKIRFTNFGMYISDLIKVVEFEDGTEFQLNDNTETINLIPFEIETETSNDFKKVKLLAEKFVEDYPPPLQVKKEKELQHYNEYLGSKTNEYGKRNDYFLFYVDNKNSAIVRLSYFLKNKERVLPIFLEEIKNIKYINNNINN
ncbi:hypothetical protein [Caloranaerobacter sp. DY30410]|uniref:hypothetical protein n=1 Tax=Caloranaerobacter sp. DY30410 TaxID=3238305 RepID=UPI003D07D770